MYCKHSELLDVDSGRTYWRTSPNYVFCVQRNHNVSAPFPTPTSPKAACYDDTESTGLGCRGWSWGGLPLRFSSPLLANCEILAQLLRFQVSVSSFVKQGKLFPPFRVVGDINNGSIGRARCHWWHMYLIGPLWFLCYTFCFFLVYVVGP